MDFPHCQAVHSEGLLMPSHDHDEGVDDSLTSVETTPSPCESSHGFLLESLGNFLKVL